MVYSFLFSNRRKQRGNVLDRSENSGTSSTVQGESNSFKSTKDVTGNGTLEQKRRTSKLSNCSNNSSKSLSASARTIKCHPGRGHERGADRSTSIKLVPGVSSRSNSSKSWISDLDLESGEMVSADMHVIGESSQEDEEDEQFPISQNVARMRRRPQHDDETTSDDLHESCDFTLATANSNMNHNFNFSRRMVDSDQISAGNVTNSNNSGDFDERGSVDETKSVMMDRKRAVKVGRPGTRFVYAVLICTATVLSLATYFFVRNSERHEFESEFRSYARETADLAETNAAHTFSQLETLATTVTSAGLLGDFPYEKYDESTSLDGGMSTENNKLRVRSGTWPNVTIPHFEERILDLSKSAGATMLLYVPLLRLEDRDGFEIYANIHAPWERSAEFKNKLTDKTFGKNSLTMAPQGESFVEGDKIVLTKPDMFYNNSNTSKVSAMESVKHGFHGYHESSESSARTDGYKSIHECRHHNHDIMNITGYENLHEFMDDVLELNGISNSEGLTAPIYQYGGPNHVGNDDSEIALMDLLSHPVFKKEIIASMEYDVPVITEHLDVSFLQDALSTTASSITKQENSKLVPLSSLRSFTLDRVRESFDDGAYTVGYVVGIVPWSSFFRNVLQEETNGSASIPDSISFDDQVNGIVVKVVSDCGSVFTFVLNSRDEEMQAYLGDWKEQYWEYEHLEYVSRFFFKEHPKGLSKHCHFDLHIYPNNEFRKSFETNQAWVYSLIVLSIFGFTILLFACYDAFIFKGQEHIVSEAAGMVVENARRAAQNERDLNDFIAHEVRNPLAAAISACAFVSSSIADDQNEFGNHDRRDREHLPLISTNQKRMEVQADIKIIDSSLHFINDLLRNMLDMQRAGSKQIDIENRPTDIMNDIFKPVEAMMHLRDVPFKIILECSTGSNEIIRDSDDEDQLIVMTDPLRLKQVVLNLTRNASKFVEKGFIRCSAKVNPINGLVVLYVDDSGPGIPEDKRKRVFGKFQQSLDVVEQGTGIGLSLCKKMIDLMGGSLYIDEDYHSGIAGCPGTRFVIQLRIPPLQLTHALLDDQMTHYERARVRRKEILNSESTSQKLGASHNSKVPNERMARLPSVKICTSSDATDESEVDGKRGPLLMDPEASQAEPQTPESKASTTKDAGMLSLPDSINENRAQVPADKSSDSGKKESCEEDVLPKNFSVLFVDDDMILRKLFSRTLKKVNPTWTIQEAASGEIAIEVIDTKIQEFNEKGDTTGKVFDLIFMDQYMASTQKQLLGTETVRVIRSKGLHAPIICGLSANDVEDAFHDAGSDAFMFKPFPCKKEELERELLRVLNSRR